MTRVLEETPPPRVTALWLYLAMWCYISTRTTWSGWRISPTIWPLDMVLLGYVRQAVQLSTHLSVGCWPHIWLCAVVMVHSNTGVNCSVSLLLPSTVQPDTQGHWLLLASASWTKTALTASPAVFSAPVHHRVMAQVGVVGAGARVRDWSIGRAWRGRLMKMAGRRGAPVWPRHPMLNGRSLYHHYPSW